MNIVKIFSIELLVLLTACSSKQETKEPINDINIIKETDTLKIEDLLNRNLEEQKKTNELLKENIEATNNLYEALTTSDKEVVVVEVPKIVTQIIEKEKLVDTKEENKDFTLTEERLFESGSTISFENVEDKTYIFQLQLYSEPLLMAFNNEVDLNTMSIELYDNDKISTVYLNQEENTIYCDEELDGVFYLVLKDLPQGTYEINIGY